jgi:hypothetical protein
LNELFDELRLNDVLLGQQQIAVDLEGFADRLDVVLKEQLTHR